MPISHKALLLIATFLALSHPVLADLWYEHYATAEKALAEEQWGVAIEELNSALEKKGDSGARARTYGMKFTSYFPYLKLGIAYYELGEFDAALQAFETEERLGAILQSDPQRAELTRYRGLTSQAQEAADQNEAVRVRSLVEESLTSAAQLESTGDLEGAITALSQAVAVSPGESRALDSLQRLRADLARRQQDEELRNRVAELLDGGREYLHQGLFAEASSEFRQALALDENSEAGSLLDEAQRLLRDELLADRRSRSVADGLSEATELQQAGKIEAALNLLQSILALDPANSTAQNLERDLLEQQSQRDQDRVRNESISGLLKSAETALTEGRNEAALAAANRILGLEPGNDHALDQLARAYRAINGLLMGTSPRLNIPPAIRFVNRRLQLEDGTLAEVVRSPQFSLNGVVIDNSPVRINLSTTNGSVPQPLVTTQSLGDLFITQFQLTLEIRPGSTTLRLIATDEEKLSSSAEYAVVYSPPIFRLPAFYAALAVLLAVCAGAVVAARTRKNRQLHQRRFNPYKAGAPVHDDKLFFGREQLLQRILQTLHNNSLLLHGERRIGKTTLQHQLKRRLEALEDPTYEFYPVYIDLQGTKEDQFFATLGQEIFDELHQTLNGLEPSAPFADSYSYRELVADLRAILRTLRQRSSKSVRLVLLIDEVDELNSYDPKINQKLRSLFMKSFAENMVAVVSGVAIKREWDREGSPWYNFFEEIDVGPFEPEHARKLVEEPIRGIFQLRDGVVERIVELTGGRPYRIQRLCMKLVSRAYESKSRSISVADVEAIGDPDSRGMT